MLNTKPLPHAVLIALLLIIAAPVFGKTRYQYVMDQLRGLSADRLSYDYAIRLTDIGSGQTLDSIVGRLYRLNGSYIDSSNAGFTALNGQFYCALEHKTRSAVIIDVELLKAQMGDDAGTPQIGPVIADSFALIPGSLTIDTTSPYFYKIRWQTEQLSASWFTARVRKGDLRLTDFTIETTQSERGKPALRHTLSIYAIRNSVQEEAFDLRRIFSRNGSTVRLNPRFETYHIKSLLK